MALEMAKQKEEKQGRGFQAGRGEERGSRGGRASRSRWRTARRGRDEGGLRPVLTWLHVRTRNRSRALSRNCVGHKGEAQTEGTSGLGALKLDPNCQARRLHSGQPEERAPQSLPESCLLPDAEL